MKQVLSVFQQLLPDFVEQVSERIIVTHVPVYETLPRLHVQEALFNAIGALGIDLARGTTSTYAKYWRDVALQRAQQGVSPVHSMQVTQISSDVMTSLIKQHFVTKPQAVVWWLEQMHQIISFGMLAMTEARMEALQNIGAGPTTFEQTPLLAPRATTRANFERLASTNRRFFVVDQPTVPAMLRIQALGGFRVWRDDHEVTTWGRRSAHSLLALLVSQRGEWLHRDQIMEVLWPDADPVNAESRFKVALNALTNALEPQRSSRQQSPYIERRTVTYRLAVDSAYVSLDALKFELILDQAQRMTDEEQKIALLRAGLKLYAGDYLPDCLYDDWAFNTRERLLQRFVAASCDLASLLLATNPQEAIRYCEAALQRDPVYERAYQLMIQAHLQQGNRQAAQRTHERCVTMLKRELGLESTNFHES